MPIRPLDIFIVLGLLTVLGLLFHIALVAKSEGVKCEYNPLVYAADKLSEANNADFIGSGYFNKQGTVYVKFDRHNITISKNIDASDTSTINWTQFKNFSFSQN